MTALGVKDGLTWASGHTVTDFVDGVQANTMRLGHELTRDGLDRFKHNTELNTPVQTAHLRDSYRIDPLIHYGPHEGLRAAAYAWEGRFYTEVEYAEYVERGTGLWGPEHRKYEIRPKKPGGVLAFAPYMRGGHGGVIFDVHESPAKGGTVVVRYVMHPGSPGAAMFRIGAVQTEAEVDQWAAEALRRWQRDSQDAAALTVGHNVQWTGSGFD